MEKTFSCQDCQAEQWCQLHLHSQQVVFTDSKQPACCAAGTSQSDASLYTSQITALLYHSSGHVLGGWGVELGQTNT